MAETKTRPRRWQFLLRWNRDKANVSRPSWDRDVKTGTTTLAACVTVACRLNLTDFLPAQTLSFQPSADWYKVFSTEWFSPYNLSLSRDSKHDPEIFFHLFVHYQDYLKAQWNFVKVRFDKGIVLIKETLGLILAIIWIKIQSEPLSISFFFSVLTPLCCTDFLNVWMLSRVFLVNKCVTYWSLAVFFSVIFTLSTWS